jgi:hypothetical protein
MRLPEQLSGYIGSRVSWTGQATPQQQPELMLSQPFNSFIPLGMHKLTRSNTNKTALNKLGS